MATNERDMLAALGAAGGSWDRQEFEAFAPELSSEERIALLEALERDGLALRALTAWEGQELALTRVGLTEKGRRELSR